MANDLSIAVIKGIASSTVTVVGELDIATAPQLRNKLTPLGGDITLDLSGVECLDAFGLAVLIARHRDCERQGHRLTITGLAGGALRTVQVTHFDTVLHLQDELAARRRAKVPVGGHFVRARPASRAHVANQRSSGRGREPVVDLRLVPKRHERKAVDAPGEPAHPHR